MARFAGNVGFVTQVREGDITKEVAFERKLFGDVINNAVKLSNSDTINPNFTIGNSFSVVASPFVIENAYAIRYVEWLGQRWSVTEVKVTPPRLILRVGELYHGTTP